MDLDESLLSALAAAKAEQEKAGRSDRGRHLSLVITKLEEALLWSKAASVLTAKPS